MSNTFLGVLTGNDHFSAANPVKAAIAARLTQIVGGITEGDSKEFAYDGNRCKPENLGWRFQQWFGAPNPQEILDGKWDAELEQTYHDAAGAEYYYRHEKDWGH